MFIQTPLFWHRHFLNIYFWYVHLVWKLHKGMKMQLNIILNKTIESLIFMQSFACIPILASKLWTKLWLRIFLHNTIYIIHRNESYLCNMIMSQCKHIKVLCLCAKMYFLFVDLLKRNLIPIRLFITLSKKKCCIYSVILLIVELKDKIQLYTFCSVVYS